MLDVLNKAKADPPSPSDERRAMPGQAQKRHPAWAGMSKF